MNFSAIVKRTVYLVNAERGEKEKFTIAISAPYRPAKTSGMGDHAACLVQVYEEIDDEGSEVFGADEFEALENAIKNVNLILAGMVASGNVETADGRPFSLTSESKFTNAFQAVQEKVKRKFEKRKRPKS